MVKQLNNKIMTKQEFMAMSLPYGLYCSVNTKERNYTCVKQNNTDYALEFHDKLIVSYPILRPLSDLTKEIEHKGEKFVPMIKLAELKVIKGLYEDIAPTIPFYCEIVKKPFGLLAKCTKLDKWVIMISLGSPERADFWVIQKLIEWHFDIDGLIDKGEAIGINTIEGFNY